MKYKLIVLSILLLIPLVANAITCLEPTGVIISTSENKLALCENGQLLRQFYIAIGQNGIGKMRSGDRKTPLGDYFLERPHFSQRFGLFIPIDYPTRRQKTLGYTGSAVGIHGPLRINNWFVKFRAKSNWTDGCIALSSDKEIMQIAYWTQKHQPATVRIVE